MITKILDRKLDLLKADLRGLINEVYLETEDYKKDHELETKDVLGSILDVTRIEDALAILETIK